MGILALTGCGTRDRMHRDVSWTGETRPAEVIVARQELMEHIEELMEPIDSLQVGSTPDPAKVAQHAEVIGAMLTAVPHLFPPTTNLYDPSSIEPKTLALPAVWTDFDSFYQLARAAAAAAARLAKAEGMDAQRDAAIALRGTCDGCHALFLRKYVPPKVLPSDLEFDFDSVFSRASPR